MNCTTIPARNRSAPVNDGQQSYSFDLNGNRTMVGDVGYTTGVNNQITSDGTWNYYADRAGNIVQRTNVGTGAIWQYAFDNRNRMTSAKHTTDAGVQVDASYSYDAFGRRVQKVVTTGAGTTTTRFAYDDSQQIWADTDGDDALTMRYLLGDGALERLARIDDAGEASWLLQDRLGSVRQVTDADGEVIDTIDYDGFGAITEQTSAEDGGDYLFAGYRRDAETGFYRPDPSAGRVYAPTIGRWWSVDPIGFAGGDANLWRYVGNDGVNGVDSDGLQGANVSKPLCLVIPSMQASLDQMQHEGCCRNQLKFRQGILWNQEPLRLNPQRHVCVFGNFEPTAGTQAQLGRFPAIKYPPRVCIAAGIDPGGKTFHLPIRTIHRRDVNRSMLDDFLDIPTTTWEHIKADASVSKSWLLRLGPPYSGQLIPYHTQIRGSFKQIGSEEAWAGVIPAGAFVGPYGCGPCTGIALIPPRQNMHTYILHFSAQANVADAFKTVVKHRLPKGYRFVLCGVASDSKWNLRILNDAYFAATHYGAGFDCYIPAAGFAVSESGIICWNPDERSHYEK